MLGRLRKSTKSSNHDCRSPGRDSNQSSPEYETAKPTPSVHIPTCNCTSVTERMEHWGVSRGKVWQCWRTWPKWHQIPSRHYTVLKLWRCEHRSLWATDLGLSGRGLRRYHSVIKLTPCGITQTKHRSCWCCANTLDSHLRSPRFEFRAGCRFSWLRFFISSY
jgi:hypothetical protein